MGSPCSTRNRYVFFAAALFEASLQTPEPCSSWQNRSLCCRVRRIVAWKVGLSGSPRRSRSWRTGAYSIRSGACFSCVPRSAAAMESSQLPGRGVRRSSFVIACLVKVNVGSPLGQFARFASKHLLLVRGFPESVRGGLRRLRFGSRDRTQLRAWRLPRLGGHRDGQSRLHEPDATRGGSSGRARTGCRGVCPWCGPLVRAPGHSDTPPLGFSSSWNHSVFKEHKTRNQPLRGASRSSGARTRTTAPLCASTSRSPRSASRYQPLVSA